MELRFRELLDRCPSLANDPQIAALLSKEQCSEKNAPQVIQKLLLTPNLTVMAASCFRPLLLEVIQDLVSSLQELPAVSLETHENVCIAFSKLLELSPFLLSVILQYFTFASAPFQRLLHTNGVASSGASLLEVVRASYRFLLLEPKSFRELWDWSPFLNLLQWTGTGTKEPVADIRWCSVQILSLVFRMSDAASRDLSSRVSNLLEEEAFACLLSWEEFVEEVAVEKASWPCMDAGNIQKSTAVDPGAIIEWKQQRGKFSYVSVCGIELPVRPGVDRSRALQRSSFVVTLGVKSQIESVALALSQKQPVLLEGPLGSGKSSLIRELAGLTGNKDTLFIHLDDQMDIKILLGNYVCTEIPGEFKWQPGTLAQAMERGLWVVFEDIDKAPSELFSSLVSLLEDRRLQVPGRGETICAAENFRLFATVSRMKFGSSWKSGEGRDSFSYLWRKIAIDAPSEDALSLIIKERFPVLNNLTEKLIGTLSLVRDLGSQSFASVTSTGVSIHIGRHFSTRDLVKYCKRVAGLAGEALEKSNSLDSVRDQIFLEAVDCFVACVNNSADRQLLMRAIAGQWGVPRERAEFYYNLYKPSCQDYISSLRVGRVNLACLPAKGK